MEDKEVTEEFLKNETKTELDAIHPRFMEPQNAQVLREYQIKHDYYCDQCKLFFSPGATSVKNHFDGKIVKHKPYASCFYCRGQVFQYKFNNERRLYHNCEDYRNRD